MEKTIPIIFSDDEVIQINFEVPGKCPHCGKIMSPEFLGGRTLADSSSSYLSDGYSFDIAILLKCTMKDCGSYYALQYSCGPNYNQILSDFDFPTYGPTPYTYSPKLEIDIPEKIISVSPRFQDIYTQSLIADSKGLNEIAGMGFRKAIEFLVTDYLLAYPNNGIKETTLVNPKTTLGTKIACLPNKIKDLAKAISYLGNDEAHYTKQHPNYDIESLKAFVVFLISEIDNELKYHDVLKIINKKPK